MLTRFSSSGAVGERAAPASLENTISRPPTFPVASIALKASFSSLQCFFPRGIDDSTTPCAADSLIVRPTAPMPNAVAQRVDGPTMLGLRPQLQAFIAANGVVHYDARFHGTTSIRRVAPSRPSTSGGGGPDDLLARGLLAEFKAALGATSATVAGPHATQPPRRVAATLLLPMTRAGKQRVNADAVSLLDAFAAIARSPLCSASKTTSMPESKDADTATSAVRFSVAAGEDDVVAFADGVGILSSGPLASVEWKRTPVLCFSFIHGSDVRHVPIAVGSNSTHVQVTPVSATTLLQEAARFAQMNAGGGVVLPPGFLRLDHVSVADDDDQQFSTFLHMQAELQREFRKLHIRDVDVGVPRDTISRIVESSALHSSSSPGVALLPSSSEARQRFVRMCPVGTPPEEFANNYFNHIVGVLFCNNQELLASYLRRCRDSEQSPIYGLSPPIDDECSCEPTVLFWQNEVVSIGPKLCLFFPRVGLGDKVTDFEFSRIEAVVPRLWPVARVLESRHYILPCTDASATPAMSPSSRSLCRAFGNLMEEAITQCSALQGREDLALRLCQESVKEATNTPEDLFHGALLGARLGQPATTIRDAYNFLLAHNAPQRAETSTFLRLVTLGMSKSNPDSSLSDLLARAVDTFAEALDLDAGAPAKRARTPAAALCASAMADIRPQPSTSDLSEASTVAAPTPQPRRSGGLVAHFRDPAQFRRLTALAGVKVWLIPEFSTLGVPWPIDGESTADLKFAVWTALASSGDCKKKWKDALDIAYDGPLSADGLARAFGATLRSHAATAKVTETIDAFMLLFSVSGPAHLFKFNHQTNALDPDAEGLDFVAVRAKPRKKVLFAFHREDATSVVLTVFRSF